MIIQLVLLAVGMFLLFKFGLPSVKVEKKDETLAEAYEAAIKREQDSFTSRTDS